MVEIVAGRPVEAERHVARAAVGLAQQHDRKAPADMRRIEQRAIGAVVDVEFGPAPPLDADEQAGIFGRQRTAGLAPQFRRIADG